jgi:predicted aspartyl protease
MISGIVNADFEAIISLSICDSEGKVYTQDAIVDTGFNGWLSLPPDLIDRLNRKDEDALFLVMVVNAFLTSMKPLWFGMEII